MKSKTDIVLLTIMIVAFLVVIVAAMYFLLAGNFNLTWNSPKPVACTQEAKICPDGSSVGRTGPNCDFAQCPDATAGWNTVTNSQLGIQFKYPTDFGSKYASFSQDPKLVVTATGNSSIDAKGCYVLNVGGKTTESNTTINNIPFCLSSAGDPGAGQLYNSYYYTTLKNGNYITLQYQVHTLNGCGPYVGTPDEQPCNDFMANYNTIVVKPIENSVATLTFTK